MAIIYGFADGVEGELDVSHWVEWPTFAALKDREVFETVHISDHDSISWGVINNVEVETCPESSYARLVGVKLEDIQTMDWDEFDQAVEKGHREYHSQL